MKVLNNKNIEEERYTAITLGNFDGIHLGHKKLIFSIKKYAEKYSLKSIVFSFFPHPKTFFNVNGFQTIFSGYEKEKIIEEFDIDELVQFPFTRDFAQMRPEDFAYFIFDKLRCKVLVVGEDYCFGKDRKGNYNLLKEIGDKKGAEVIKILSVMDNGIRVSSTHIRKCIEEKNFYDANRLLGRPYFVLGKVMEGKKIGRKIDFPTANIITPDYKLLPPDGVYLTKTMYAGNIYKSITNVGKNPTVNGKNKTVETYIIGFDDDLYDKEIKVLFYDFIRNEQKFNSVNELKEQISKDIKNALEMFKKNELREKD